MPTRALDGVSVLEIGTYLAAPLATLHLANLGASVCAIKRPIDSRGAREEEKWLGDALGAALTAGKTITPVDLRLDADKARLHMLLKTSHVLVTNFSASTLSKHGLDAEACAGINPRLIHVWLPGFASADDPPPKAWESADDSPPKAWEAVILAASGVFRDMGVNRQLLGVAASYSPLPLASAYASVWAALAACAALYRNAAHGGGSGSHALGEAIEVPLASALVETLCHNSLQLDGLPEHYLSARMRRLAEQQPCDGNSGVAAGMRDYFDVQALLDPFYASYTCRDARPFYLVCPSHRAHQERAIDALGIRAGVTALGVPVAQPYADEPPAATAAAAGAATPPPPPPPPRHGLGAAQMGDAHAAGLRRLLRAAFLTRTALEWEARLGAAGVPGAAHRSTAEWLSSQHAIDAGLVVPADEDGVGGAGGEGGGVRPGPIAWVLEEEVAAEEEEPPWNRDLSG